MAFTDTFLTHTRVGPQGLNRPATLKRGGHSAPSVFRWQGVLMPFTLPLL